MKILISALLGTLLFVESAHCLQCYTCTEVEGVASSCQVSTCLAGQSTCAKAVLTSNFAPGKTYVKVCATSCEDFKNQITAIQSQEVNVEPHCCETDLCNGVGGVTSNLWALAGALLLSLGPALLWAGL